MKTVIKGQLIRFPIRSIAYSLHQRSPKGFLTNSDEDGSSLSKRSKFRLPSFKFGKKADTFAHGIKEHLKLGTNIRETLTGKLSLGVRILQFGGYQKIFERSFCLREGEKLLKAFQCYLSTTSGLISGLLFASTDKIAFCSQKSISFSSSRGEVLRACYKVVIPVSDVKRIERKENIEKPSQKYIEVVTVDDFDFWFTGFLNYKKAFKHLQDSFSQSYEYY